MTVCMQIVAKADVLAPVFPLPLRLLPCDALVSLDVNLAYDALVKSQDEARDQRQNE